MASTEDTQEKQAIEANDQEKINKKFTPAQASLCTDRERSENTREVVDIRRRFDYRCANLWDFEGSVDCIFAAMLLLLHRTPSGVGRTLHIPG